MIIYFTTTNNYKGYSIETDTSTFKNLNPQVHPGLTRPRDHKPLTSPQDCHPRLCAKLFSTLTLVSHHTDPPLYIFALDLDLFSIINNPRIKNRMEKPGRSHNSKRFEAPVPSLFTGLTGGPVPRLSVSAVYTRPDSYSSKERSTFPQREWYHT